MNLTLSYQPQTNPPPFAYAAVIRIEQTHSQTKIEFDLQYIDRDEVSPDELRAEGFSENDDFSWSGTIGSDWNLDIQQFGNYQFTQDPDSQVYLHVEIDGVKLGFPKKIVDAELIFQELMQAVLESAQVESPLVLHVKTQKSSSQIKWVFAERAVYINGRKSTQWSKGRTLLKTIYSIDYEAIKPSKKAINDSIQLEDELWYPLRDRNTLSKVSSLIGEL